MIRFVGNTCRGEEVGLEGAGVRGLGGFCMMCPKGEESGVWAGGRVMGIQYSRESSLSQLGV